MAPPPNKGPLPAAPPNPTPIGRWTFAIGIILIVIGIAIWIKSLLVDGQSPVTTTLAIIFGVGVGVVYSFIQIHQYVSAMSLTTPTWLKNLYGNTKLVKVIDYGIPVIAVAGLVVALVLPYPATSAWTTVAEGAAPICDGVNNTAWKVSDGLQSATGYRCLSTTHELEIIPSSTATLAEIDLEQVNGKSYSQARFDISIQVGFEAAQADSSTLAGLVVQTPQHGKGGYILAMNNTGYWELVDNNASRRASHGLVTTAHTFTIEVKVEQGDLYCVIENQQVCKIADTLNTSSGVIGLVVYGYNPPLPAVTFSNFSLSV